MSETFGIVEGWTGNIDFQLTDDDAAANITNDTLTAEAIDKSRNSVTLTGDLSVINATDGTIRLTPDTGDFLSNLSPYELRFKRVLSGGGAIYYPNEEAIVLNVRPWP